MIERKIAVIGASCLIGECLFPVLEKSGRKVIAYSRSVHEESRHNVEWRVPSQTSPRLGNDEISDWICLAPIWVLPDYFGLLDTHGVRRFVALSSTSRFSKQDSSDPQEQALSLRFSQAEARVQAWAESSGVEWVILRPTLIYGLGQDKNISEIARLIRRFGFFPLFGKANGLRQPIHAADVADACLAALQAPGAANRAYNISGGEILSYRDMVSRVFSVLNRRQRMLTVPLWIFRLAVKILNLLPRYRHWSAAMAERMNRDMVFDHSDAKRDFGFSPRSFQLGSDDSPI